MRFSLTCLAYCFFSYGIYEGFLRLTIRIWAPFSKVRYNQERSRSRRDPLVPLRPFSKPPFRFYLRHGVEQFTTTRVAERPGVSVGTLYQYYPNKQSLLFAVLERHLNLVIRAWNARAEKIIIGLWRRWWLPLFTPTSVPSWIKQTHR